MSDSTEKRKILARKRTVSLCIFICFVLIISVLYCFLASNRTVQGFDLIEYNIKLEHWHPEHNGLKIAIVSDLHQHADLKEQKRTLRIVEAINAQDVDLVFMLGDYLVYPYQFTGKELSIDETVDLIKGIKSRYGVYAVLGNHDWWESIRKLRIRMTEIGFNVMENQVEELIINGKTINIIGVPDMYTRRKKISWNNLNVTNGEPTLVLSHNPLAFCYATIPFDLMFAGHTHGAQLRFPLLGGFIGFKQEAKYIMGWFHDGDKRMFVTRGIGWSQIPLRTFCPPEVAIITIKKQQ